MSSGPGPAIAVIGAGLAGAACARALSDAGCRVELFDKSRAVGGRLASRHAELPEDYTHSTALPGPSANFDHGAQYFTARAPVFTAYLERCVAAGCVARWPLRVATYTPQGDWQMPRDDASARYIGVATMSEVLKPLLDGLVLHLNRPIVALEAHAGGWQLRDSSEQLSPRFDALVLALPAPQAQALLRDHATELALQCGKVEMLPCWALMALSETMPCAFDAAFIQSGPLAWLACNSSKPGRTTPAGLMSWVAHATQDWTQHHLGCANEDAAALLQRELAHLLGQPDMSFHYTAAHRWLYARAVPQAHLAAWHDAALKLALCGDFTQGERVEAAFLSGLDCAAQVLDWPTW